MAAPVLKFDEASKAPVETTALQIEGMHGYSEIKEMRAYYANPDNRPGGGKRKNLPYDTFEKIAKETVVGFKGAVPNLCAHRKNPMAGMTEPEYEDYKQKKNRTLLSRALTSILEKYEVYSNKTNPETPLDNIMRRDAAAIFMLEMIENATALEGHLTHDKLETYTFYYGAGAQSLIDDYSLSPKDMAQKIIFKQPTSPEKLLKRQGHTPKSEAANDHAPNGQ